MLAAVHCKHTRLEAADGRERNTTVRSTSCKTWLCAFLPHFWADTSPCVRGKCVCARVRARGSVCICFKNTSLRLHITVGVNK